MASFVQAITGFNGSGSNTNLFTSNFGSACTAGNSLVVAVFMDSGTATVSAITDTATTPNTYTRLATYSLGSLTAFLYIATNITANASTVYQVQVTEGVALDGQIIAQEWSGLSPAPMDSAIPSNGTSVNGTVTGNNYFSDTSNLQIFNLIMLQSQTNTYSAGSGWSNLSNIASSFTSAALESQTVANPGNTSPTYGMTATATSYIMLSVGLKTPTSVDYGGQFGQGLITQSGLSSVGQVH